MKSHTTTVFKGLGIVFSSNETERINGISALAIVKGIDAAKNGDKEALFKIEKLLTQNKTVNKC